MIFNSLDDMHGKFIERKALILGSAPSLKHFEGMLWELSNDVTVIGVNNSNGLISKIVPRIDINILADPEIAKIYGNSILHANLNFVRIDALNALVSNSSFITNCFAYPFYKAPTLNEGYFSHDIRKGVFRGFTVILDALQIVSYLGFKSVGIIGVDLDYSKGFHYVNSDPKHEALNSKTVEDLPTVLNCFDVSAKALKDRNINVVNCGFGGNLESFPRSDLTEFLEVII